MSLGNLSSPAKGNPSWIKIVRARIKVFLLWVKREREREENDRGMERCAGRQQKRSAGGPWPVIISAGPKRRTEWLSPCCCLAPLLNSSAQHWSLVSKNPRNNLEINMIGVPMDFKQFCSTMLFWLFENFIYWKTSSWMKTEMNSRNCRENTEYFSGMWEEKNLLFSFANSVKLSKPFCLEVMLLLLLVFILSGVIFSIVEYHPDWAQSSTTIPF